jgi:hypothetical protein
MTWMVSCVPTVHPVPLAMARAMSNGAEKLRSSEEDVGGPTGVFMDFQKSMGYGEQLRNEAFFAGASSNLGKRVNFGVMSIGYAQDGVA